MPQKDNYIDEFKKTDALGLRLSPRFARPLETSFSAGTLEYAVMHGDLEEAERLRAKLRALAEKM